MFYIAFTMPIIFAFTDSALAHLHPTTGQFAQRDPLKYADGTNLYEYKAIVGSTDPSGTMLFCSAPRCQTEDQKPPTGDNHDECPAGYNLIIAPDGARKCVKCKGDCPEDMVCKARYKPSVNDQGQTVYSPGCACLSST